MKKLKLIYDGTYLEIVEQTHRRSEFSHKDNIFVAKNGIKLRSESFPENALKREKTFYVRGDDAYEDGALKATPTEAALVFEAVAEYNDVFSAPPINVGPHICKFDDEARILTVGCTKVPYDTVRKIMARIDGK